MNTEYRNTKAIIIKKTKFKESSAILQCFTENYSLISVIAKGIYKKKNTFLSPCETLSINNIEYFYKPSREVQTMVKAELILYPENIIRDYNTFIIIEKFFNIIKFHKYHTHTSKILYRNLEQSIIRINNSSNPKEELIRFYINYLQNEGLFNKESDYVLKKMVVDVFQKKEIEQIEKLLNLLEERIYNT